MAPCGLPMRVLMPLMTVQFDWLCPLGGADTALNSRKEGPKWFKLSIVTFTPFQALNLLSLRELVMAPLSQEVEMITLDITTQSTLHTDAPRGIMLQRSGGLENSKFLYQTRQSSPFTKHNGLMTFNDVNFKKTQGYLQQPFWSTKK